MSNLFFPLSHCGHATSRHVSDRWSTSGFVFSLGHEAISWSSKKQPTFALSNTEAEYRGAAIATYETIGLKRLLKDFNESVNKPIHIYYDNQSSIQQPWNPVFHAWTKHVEVHYHYVRERIIAGDIDLQNVDTDQQTIDLFINALGAHRLHQISLVLGLRPIHTPSLRQRVEGEE